MDYYASSMDTKFSFAGEDNHFSKKKKKKKNEDGVRGEDNYFSKKKKKKNEDGVSL